MEQETKKADDLGVEASRLVSRCDAIEFNPYGGWDFSEHNVRDCEDGTLVPCAEVNRVLIQFFELWNAGESLKASCLLAKLQGELSG